MYICIIKSNIKHFYRLNCKMFNKIGQKLKIKQYNEKCIFMYPFFNSSPILTKYYINFNAESMGKDLLRSLFVKQFRIFQTSHKILCIVVSLLTPTDFFSNKLLVQNIYVLSVDSNRHCGLCVVCECTSTLLMYIYRGNPCRLNNVNSGERKTQAALFTVNLLARFYGLPTNLFIIRNHTGLILILIGTCKDCFYCTHYVQYIQLSQRRMLVE